MAALQPEPERRFSAREASQVAGVSLCQIRSWVEASIVTLSGERATRSQTASASQ